MTSSKSLKHHAKAGSALLVVLWVIALLSFLITTSMMVSMQDVETVISRKLVFKTRQLAEMGLALGCHPKMKADDPLLRQSFADGGSFSVKISTEEARINLNYFLTEERKSILEKLFVSWGMDIVDAQSLVDALMDWVDLDDLKRLKGAEKSDYLEAGLKGLPLNQKFRTLQEMSNVLGIEKLLAVKPDWQNSFTLLGEGKLDVNEADADLIAIVADVPLHVAVNLVNQRTGLDGIAHTEDDQRFKQLSEVLTLLGINGATAAKNADLFTLKGNSRRVESTGKMGDYSRTLEVSLASDGKGIKNWRENAETISLNK